MKFTYRATQVDRSTNRFRNHTYTLEAETWLDHIRRDEHGAYGNSAELIEAHILPPMEAGRLGELHDVLLHLYGQWRQHNSMTKGKGSLTPLKT